MTSSGWMLRRGPAALLAVVLLVGTVLAHGAVASAPAPGTLPTPDPYLPELGNTGYDVEHYDIALVYLPPDPELRGNVLIRATATRRLTRLNLDLVGLTVSRVDVDGVAARAGREDNELVVRPSTPIARGETFELRVRYSGDPDGSLIPGLGASNGWIPISDGVVTLNEPDGARNWFPANDHPQDKATYSFRITVPSEVVAIANGRLESRERRGATTTWVWRATEPMASYLTQLVVDRMEIVEGPVVDGVEVRHAFATGIRNLAQPVAEETPAMLSWFTERLGPFPFDTYGIVVPIEGLRGLAFEAQTLSVFAPNLFFDEEIASAILAHELAHQWFGDSVSPETWSETWLNEGFATYFEWLWSEREGHASLSSQVERAREAVAVDEDTAADDPGVEEMFSTATYQRGGLVVDALQRTVGEDSFRRILRIYLERFSGKTATTEDLVEVATEVAGIDMTDFFRSWLGPGPLPERPPPPTAP